MKPNRSSCPRQAGKPRAVPACPSVRAFSDSAVGSGRTVPLRIVGWVRGFTRRCGQVPGAQPEYLQVQVVVFLCLADPLHADTAYRRRSSRVGWPHDRDDLFYSLLECPPGHRQPGLGGVTAAPRGRVQLPADLELLIGRQWQQGRPSDQAPILAKFDRDRKSTRLNSSHMSISYAVFCLKKKK